MRLEVEFNEEIHRSELVVFMNKTFQPGLTKTLKTLVVGLLLIILAFYDLNKSDNSNSVIGYIMLGLGIHYIIQCLNHFYFVYKSKREYRVKIEKDILRMNQPNQLIVMEFTEDHFSYEELDYNSQIKWNMFKCFRIVEDNIFLDMDRGIQTSYIINKLTISDSAFQNVIDFLSERIDRVDELKPKSKRKNNPNLIDN